MLGAIKSTLQPLLPRPSTILGIQSAPLPRQPSYLSPRLRHRVLTCSSTGFQQPNQLPQLPSPTSPRGPAMLPSRRLPLSPRANQPASQPASPSLPLSSFWAQGRHSPRGAHTSVALQNGLHRCFACLPACSAPVPSRWPIVSPPHSHQCYRRRSLPILAAINIPVHLGNPLPLAKHVSSLQGMPRGGGECHPLTSPDRLATHEMTLSTGTRDAPSGLQTTTATTLCPQILPRLRGAHGNRVCPLLRDLFRRRMATHRLASYFSSIVHPLYCGPCQSFVFPARRRILSRPSAMCITTWW